MTNQNWRTETNAQDYFGHQQKKLQVADRRPVIRRASDLVGPGIGANAVRVTDFNDLLATYNGFFSADVAATNAPNATDTFAGTVSSDATLGGVQQFTSLTSGVVYVRVFTRNPADASAVYFGAWNVGPLLVTSTTRPAHNEGLQIYETDTDRLLISNGSGWWPVRPISGAGTINLVAQQAVSGVVNFGFTFPAAPVVTASSGYADVPLGISNITTAGFTITVYRISGAATITVGFNWLASKNGG